MLFSRNYNFATRNYTSQQPVDLLTSKKGILKTHLAIVRAMDNILKIMICRELIKLENKENFESFRNYDTIFLQTIETVAIVVKVVKQLHTAQLAPP